MIRQPRPRHSSPSSSSSEFEFNISISPRKASSSLCPADELFYKGQLLPLHLSPRLSLVRTLCSSSTSSSSSAARDSTESSSSSTDSTSSSRPSSATDEEDIFFKQTNKSGFSISRLSSVFKKDPKTVSAAAPTAPPSSVRRMSSTAKEVIRKYMKKVKPLYDKLSQKQSITTVTALKTESSVSVKDSRADFNTESSFSGNVMKHKKRGRCAASCPSSMRSSPTHSGVLTRGGFLGQRGGSNSVSSSMEELQSAVQGAIAHCKNSMLEKSLVSSTSLEI